MRYLKNWMNRILSKVFKDKAEVTLFIAGILIETVFGIYLTVRYGITYESGDSISHMYIVRSVVDNGAQSSLGNIGTAWLPLFHVWAMPLAVFDFLYRTGLAGTIINALATGGICVTFCRLLGNNKLAAFASGLFLANAFTLFFGATPMTEQTGMFFMVFATYQFKSYWEGNDLKAFMKCSLVLILGTLTRYELWIITVLVALLFVFKELKEKRLYRLAYVQFPFWGVIAWFLWNTAIFRNPLMFLFHPMSPAHIVERLYELGNPYTGDVIFTVGVAFQVLHLISGTLFVVSFISLIFLAYRRRWGIFVASFLLIAIFPIQLFFALIGVNTMFARYFYPTILGLIVIPLFLMKEISNSIKSKRILKLITIAMSLLIVASYAVALPAQLQVASTGLVPESPRAGGSLGDPQVPVMIDWMKEYSHVKAISENKLILVAGLQSYQCLSIIGKQSSEIIDDYDGAIFIMAMQKPWDYCQIVLIPEVPPDSSVVKAYNELYTEPHYIHLFYNNATWQSKFLEYYKLVTVLNSSSLESNIDVFELVK
jgi:hypothetical protein